uniref:ATP-dependent helicase n=1 Tax=Prevotella sp. TaxID=59823 RepID=UPI0040285C74
MDTLLKSLNPNQLAAVEYTDGPELIIAGAGSGKTRVLTYKIAYLLQKGLAPWSILALTFTNKAAREMKSRVAELVGEDRARYLNMGTFHSVFLRILRAEAEAVGLQRNFSIYDDGDSRGVVNSIIKEMQLDDKQYKASAILGRIGAAKNSLVTPEVYMSDPHLMERDKVSSMPKLGQIYAMYAARCKAANAVDFDDMLLFTYKLFAENPQIAKKYAERFCYVLVDEYQDTNYAQQAILTLLTKEQRNICVVGDDAQSIYAFRGANIDNILKFQSIYEGARLFKLEQNYRSTQTIVKAANSVIVNNQRQIRKEVFSENGDGEKVHLNIAYSDKEEASVVCNEIRRLHNRYGVAYRDIAVLYRTNAQSRLFEEELRRQDTPYRIYGGMSFYQHKEIKDVIAYFRFVANPNDEEALKRVINYPKRGIGDTTISKLIAASRACNVSLWDVVGNPSMYNAGVSAGTEKKVLGFYYLIDEFIRDNRTVDAYGLGKEILEKSGLKFELAADKSIEGAERQENIEEFMSGLHDFVDTKREEGYEDEVYIANFLQEVALLTDSDEENDDDNDASSNERVSLMTIHASKGLEFNSVFIVGLEENIFPSPRSCSSVRELEEERRLLYVAITRAEQRCFLSCAKSRYQYGSMMFNEPSRFLKEIDKQYLAVEGNAAGFKSSERQPQPFQSRPQSQPFQSRPQSQPYHEAPQRNPFQSTMPSGFRCVQTVSQRFQTSASTQRMQASASSQRQTIHAGARVEHQRFGLGTVVAVEGVGENEKATIEFQNAGTKTLLMKFARLTVLK